ncbi:MAG: FKBP-type peptidyl-prolyl cis-trans isomerase [Sphaerochaetaceae bacterium]|nr:FKBP-type peptidyl-prolyl cis-trans isomerase [Sphaerochaetaceae bacterium]
MTKKIIAILFVLCAVMTFAFAQSIVESSTGRVIDNNPAPEPVPVDSLLDRALLQNPETLLEKFSYTLGYFIGPDYFYMYQYYYYPEALEYFGMLGAYDAELGTCLYTEEEMEKIIADYEDDYLYRLEHAAADNLAVAEAFLEENAKLENVNVTESGLQYIVVEQGTGPCPTFTDTVELDYQLMLLDGTVVDSSYVRGEHASFPLTQVIEGFSEGVQLMPVGSHYVFFIHPSLGYGESSMSSMGPNSLLIFEVETYAIL